MDKVKTRATFVVSLAALASLVGCVTTIPVKTMLDNREQFLGTYFSPAKIPPNVHQALDHSGAPELSFKKMNLNYKVEFDDDGRKKSLTGNTLLLNAGNGLVQQQAELSNNGFPYRINNSLSFLGFQRVIWNSGFHDQAQSQLTSEVKEMRRLDKGIASAKPGDEFTFEITSGTTVQTVNYLQGKQVCKAGELRPASKVHAKLTGQSVSFECTAYDANQTLLAKHEYVFLKDYGVALEMGMSSSKAKTVFEYTDAEVTR